MKRTYLQKNTIEDQRKLKTDKKSRYSGIGEFHPYDILFKEQHSDPKNTPLFKRFARMKKYTLAGTILFFLGCFAISCTQEEGIGGNSHIKGNIQINYYNDDFTTLLSDEPVAATDEDVYLVFGDDSVIGDKVTTSNSGDFSFEYLWPGNYKLYYYSDDTTGLSDDKVPVVKNITLAKGEILVLDDLILKKKLDWNEGTSSIKGTVYVINYKNSSSYPNLVIKDITAAQEQEIYITYGDHSFYDDRIKTAGDGTFMFQNLIKGTYKIFLYSENKAGSTQLDVIEKEIEITENNTSYVISDTIYVDKL